MKAVIQRVKKASVLINHEVHNKINQGLLIYLAIHDNDTQADIDKMVKKITHMRIFADSSGKMNQSLLDQHLESLIISQFTLYADCKKGNRPFFGESAKPQKAKSFYELFIQKYNQFAKAYSGIFAADMAIESINHGPVTIILNSKDL